MKQFLRTAISVLALSLAWSLAAIASPDTLRVLSIANSFGEDAVEQNLHEIALADGHVMIIGNLYIGGCSIEQHDRNARKGSKAYSYRKVSADGSFSVREKVKLSQALLDEPWDVVVVQQASHDSGKMQTYEPYLTLLLSYVKARTPAGVRLCIHQTWSYEEGATHWAFPDYGSSSYGMYEKLCEAYSAAAARHHLDVIPSGTAIQNARATFLRHQLSRDGYHLSRQLGRYVAAATYYAALYGCKVEGNTWVHPHLDPARMTLAQRCADAAVKNPFNVTRVDGSGFWAKYDSIPEYTLPNPLVMQDGTPVSTPEQWYGSRRKELLDMFSREMFGYAPAAPEVSGEVIEEGSAFGGKALRRQVDIHLSGKRVIHLLVYTPADAKGPVPVFLGINFNGNLTVTDDPAVLEAANWKSYGIYPREARGSQSSRWPISEIIARGYGVATFHCSDIDPDYDDGGRNGVVSMVYREGQTYPEPDQWGTIAQWAWGLSRALDYLENDDRVDASRVAVFGHSRLGKTALWAGAQDERFAMVISNDSGCGGAALSRRRFGETVAAINAQFPHWFCDNFKKYSDKEDELPFDQHELLACVAPRPLYVASAEEDSWADPVGERLALQEAASVYRFLGESPALLGYHIRQGRHDITLEDWLHYLDFADYHFGRR